MTPTDEQADQALLRLVFDSLPHALLAWSPEGRCRTANAAAVRMLERPREELLACDLGKVSNFLDRSTDPEAARLFREALETGSSLASTSLVLSQAGRPLPVRADLTGLQGGGCVLTLAVLPDAPSREEIFERTVLEFYEHTPDPVVVHRRGVILYANPATLGALRYQSLEEIQGRPVIELVHPDDRAKVVERIVAMTTRGEAVPILEERFLCKDGGVMTALVAALPLPYHGEQAVTVIGHDLTELKRVEAEREALLGQVFDERSVFREVIAHVPAGIAVLEGRDMVFQHVNQTFQALMPETSLVGRPISEVGDMLPHPLELLDRLPETGEPVTAKDLTVRLRRSAESPEEEASFTFSYVRVPGGEGTPDRYVLLAVETTEQVRSHRRMEEYAKAERQHSAELGAVLDNILDLVVMCDAGMRVRVLNKAARSLMGYRDGQEIDLRSLLELLDMRDGLGKRESYDEMPLARALRGEVIESADRVVSSPALGHDVWLRVSAAPIHDAAGQIVAAVSVARDVTDLIDLDRLKDQFIRVAAHELKTPVTIIKGYALTLLRSAAKIPEPLRRTLDAISRGADRIDRIVTDLVDISQVELRRLELDRESVDIAELVQSSVDRVSLAHETQRIRVVSATRLLAHVDRDRLEQVVENLLTNALGYSPEGGYVDVEIRRVDASVEISVRDPGVGIPKEKQVHIFERFYRAHTDTPHDCGGMGVGLYIAKAIVVAHGGKIWFESEEGVGSTFHLRVPLNPGTDSNA